MELTDIIRKEATHLTYKHTSLHWIIVKINYGCDSEADFFNEYADFFKDFANLSLSQDQYKALGSDSIRLKSNDGVVQLKLSSNFIQLRLSGKTYVNFSKSLKPFLEKIYSLLCNIKASISKVELRKINMWGYDSITQDSDKLLQSVFSDNLLKNFWKPLHEVEDGEDVNLTKTISDYRVEDFDGSLIATFGYIETKKENSMSRLILDTEYEIKGNFNCNELVSLMPMINDVLYNLYHSAVSKDVLQEMNKD